MATTVSFLFSLHENKLHIFKHILALVHHGCPSQPQMMLVLKNQWVIEAALFVLAGFLTNITAG